MAAFFVAAGFFAAALGFVAFLVAAGFFVAGDFAFLGVVAFFTFGVVAFFGVAAFFAAAGLAALALAFGLTCLGFFVALAALADFGVALDRGLVALAILTFFGLAAAGVAADELPVAEVFAATATFLAGLLLPADLDRARFFVPAAAVLELDVVFFGLLLVFFFVAVASAANLNEPLAPFPLVCLKCFDLTPFFKANLRC